MPPWDFRNPNPSSPAAPSATASTKKPPASSTTTNGTSTPNPPPSGTASATSATSAPNASTTTPPSTTSPARAPSRNRTHMFLGIQNFVKNGGVVGRGVLVDFARWVKSDGGKKVVDEESEGKGWRPFERSGIKVDWLKKTLESQGTELKFGDILIIRSGFLKAYLSIDAETLKSLNANSPPTVGGVEVTDELLEWIWDHFSAVAGDQVGFEELPMNQPYSAHEVLLAGWGCPIGELFDLEELSRTCEKSGRWSFFFTSQVVNVPGGVASPPNAIAIF